MASSTSAAGSCCSRSIPSPPTVAARASRSRTGSSTCQRSATTPAPSAGSAGAIVRLGLGGGREERAERRATTVGRGVRGGVAPLLKRRAKPPSEGLKRSSVLEATDQRPCFLQEAAVVGAVQGLAGDELLAERVHEPTVLRDAVVQMG